MPAIETLQAVLEEEVMNTIQRKVTEYDVFNGICADYIHFGNNQPGIGTRYMSRDVGSCTDLEYMRREALFVERVSKSEQLAIQFDKALAGTKCLRITPLGEELYQLLALPPRRNPPKQELSENLKLLDLVKVRLNVGDASFTGDPMNVIGADGLLEGEFLNIIVTRLREGTRRKSFRSAQRKRKKEARDTASTLCGLVTQIRKHRPLLFGRFLDLMYRPDQANHISLEQSANHLCRLIARLKGDEIFCASVGHLWVRRFLSEAGYRTRLFVLFDGHETPSNLVDWDAALHHWEMCTEGAGAGFAPQDLTWDMDQVLWEIECTAMRDLYLRLIPNTAYSHFGTSDLPRPPMYTQPAALPYELIKVPAASTSRNRQ